MNKNYIIVLVVLCISILSSGCSASRDLWVEEKQTSNIEDYGEIFSKDGVHPNEIFPQALPLSAQVEEFEFYYYNSFDSNYLSYLVYACEDDNYKLEVDIPYNDDFLEIVNSIGYRVVYS